MNTKPLIGFIGQGWIGKNYADDFVSRGYEVIRYAKEPEYEQNKKKIAECDIVFIAVPTPTTPEGVDFGILESVFGLVGKGKTAVIKSTMLPGKTKELQQKYPDIIIMHSPEFLLKKTAAYDAAHPILNVIGIPVDDSVHRTAAEKVLAILPNSPLTKVVDSNEAELIKYAHNVHGYIRVVYSNLLYDIAQKFGMKWENIAEVLKADPMMSPWYLDPIHKTGRGAGGVCFIKDYEAFLQFFKKIGDEKGLKILESIREKNIELLTSSGKDLDVLKSVYGDK